MWHLLGDAGREANTAKGRSSALRHQLAALIPEFLREAEEGHPSAVGDRPYTREELRALRAAMIHISTELGTMGVEDVRVWDVRSLIDQLREAGLSKRRLHWVIEGFQALFAYAVRRRLVERSPVPALSNVGQDDRPGRDLDERGTPTDAMLALGGKVVNWTERLVMVAFVVLILALGVELGLVDIPIP